MKEPDEVSEVTCEHRPDKSETGNVTLSNGPLTGGGRSRAFEPMMIDGSVFVVSNSFV
jgi:hypothetical protein